jgi:hypothetical protein
MPGSSDQARSPQPATLSDAQSLTSAEPVQSHRPAAPPREIGGPKGPEPTRFGDWEKAGRCIDF